MAHPTPAEAAEQAQRRGRGGADADAAFADVYEPLKGGEDEHEAEEYEVHEGFEFQEGDVLEEHRQEEEQEGSQTTHRAAVAARRLRDKRTRFEMDERETTLTETMTSDATYVPVMEEDNQAPHKTEDLRYQMMERKIERLEKRLEAYEGLQRKLAKSRTTYRDADSGGGAGETQQLIEFFLTEMDKQNAVIAQMRANERVLEQKLEESMRKTHRFHHEQLQRMAKFQEVVQMMNAEFVQVSMLRDEEKALEKNHQDKKTKAVRRALDEQITDLKNETSHQRRRLEIKLEKKIVDLASENQLLQAENLELRDEVTKLVMAARSSKRTVRVLSDEVIKLKRAVGAPPNPEIEEALRLSGAMKSTSKHEVSTVHPA